MSNWKLVSLAVLATCFTVKEPAHASGNCQILGCGVNGAWVGENIWFHELDWSQSKPNKEGLKIEKAHGPDGKLMHIAVEKDDLIGKYPSGKVLQYEELNGTTLFLTRSK